MEKFQSQIYKINDILGWNERGELKLDPRFQRRKVWSPRGKSYLIDSIIKGYPLPELFIREKIIIQDRKTIREVVDGQQRLRAILEFIEGKFTILPMHDEEYSKKKFIELPESIQQSILAFPLSVNTLIGSDDACMLEIFSRLNAYSVPLNSQEKINSEFVGVFKQKIDYIARQNLAYWEDNRIISGPKIARMKEVEFTAELVGAMLGGLQNGKSIIRNLYLSYDDAFPQFSYLESRFNDTLEICKRVIGDQIADTEFRRVPLFYSLFCAVYDCKYGFSSTAQATPKQLNESSMEEVRQKLYQINQSLTAEERYPEFINFVAASRSSTDKLSARSVRHGILISILRLLFNA
jgi:hypothetical protein